MASQETKTMTAMSELSGEHTVLSENTRAIIDAATKHDGTPPISDQALLAAAQGRRELIDFGDAVGVLGEGELDLVVRPTARGQGIGRRSLQALLSREDRGSGQPLRAWAHGENPAARALLERAGFSPVRSLLRMSLPPEALPDALRSARKLPPEFRFDDFELDNSDHADDWVRVNAAAFASHPEQGSMTRADFDGLTAQPWFDPADLRFAYPVTTAGPNELAGFAWVKTTRDAGETETELYALGVDPALAGIGLGAALLGEALRRMSAHRPTRITLYVDGDNLSAVALYERAGFHVEQRSTQYLLNTR